jgi:hypothetical protein
MLYLSLSCLALVCLLAYREWVGVRERREAAATLARSRAETAAERDRAATERRELYQRIQAPEIAVHDAQLEARRQRPYVRREPIGADNDAAFARRSAERQASRDREVDGG